MTKKTKRAARKAPVAKHAGGRPTDYRKAYCARVLAYGKQGKSKAQIAAKLGVTRQTLDNWANSHEEFFDAISSARDLALAWWEDKGQSCLTANRFQSTAFIFQMKNRFPDDYRDRQEFTGAGGGAIPFRLTNLSDAQLVQLLTRICDAQSVPLLNAPEAG